MTLESSSSLFLTFERTYLAVFFSLVAAFYTVRIIRLQNTLKQKVVFAGAAYCSTWWNHLAFRIFRVTIWFVCLARAFWPQVDDYLGIFNALVSPALTSIGLILLTVGFILTLTIHFKLGDLWRSGIDSTAPRSLLTDGYYAFSRNPMYVFVAIAQLGFFMVIPSVFTLVCLFVGWLTLYNQTVQEEKHLSTKFPILYPKYCSMVRRWI